MGEDGAGRREGLPARGRERSWRNAHGRDDLPRGRWIARAGDGARDDGRSDPPARPQAARAHNALRPEHARRCRNEWSAGFAIGSLHELLTPCRLLAVCGIRSARVPAPFVSIFEFLLRSGYRCLERPDSLEISLGQARVAAYHADALAFPRIAPSRAC